MEKDRKQVPCWSKIICFKTRCHPHQSLDFQATVSLVSQVSVRISLTLRRCIFLLYQIQYQVHKYNVYHLFDVLTWKSTEKGRETYRDIQYKSKPKYILWQHRTFHIPLWDQGHTTPEVFNDFFLFFYFIF